MQSNKQFYKNGKLIVKAIQKNDVILKIADIEAEMDRITSKIGKNYAQYDDEYLELEQEKHELVIQNFPKPMLGEEKVPKEKSQQKLTALSPMIQALAPISSKGSPDKF